MNYSYIVSLKNQSWAFFFHKKEKLFCVCPTSEPVSFFPLCRVQPFCFQVAVSLCNFSVFIAVLASLIWECVCRFIVGMERHSYPEFWILPGHGYIADGTRSLYTYLVASWHGIPSC